MKKIILVSIIAFLAGVGSSYSAPNFGVAETNQPKQEILKENIYLHVRLGEPPVWNVSIVSAEEMSQAYATLATEKDAKQTEDLYANLRAEASGKGLLCK